MSTAKHYSFCAGPMRGKSVEALPGIGATYGDRLSCAGYSLASDVYEKFKSLGFDSLKCQSWLNIVCGANSRYSSMAYEALKEWHEQFGQIVTPQKVSYAPRVATQEHLSPMPRLDSYHESPRKTRDSDITREEVLEMMAQFQKKHESMMTRIMTLEEEKSAANAKINSLEKEHAKTKNYVKTLEARINKTDRMATVLQKQQNTSVELYKNTSNSVYLISQKLDETLSKQAETNLDSIVSNFIKILEARIERLEENTKKYQKGQDKKLLEIVKKQNDENSQADVIKNITTSLNVLSRKMDVQNLSSKNPSSEKLLESKIEQIEKDLSHLTTKLGKLIKNPTQKKKQILNNSCVDTDNSTHSPTTVIEKRKSCHQIKLDEVVERIEAFNIAKAASA